jgi:hypothetical protein
MTVPTARPPDMLIDWGFHDPQGRRCGPPRYGTDIQLEALRLYDEAKADPEFCALTVAFCEVRYRLPWTLRLRRVAYDGETGVFLGYRQPDGSYRVEAP